MRAAGDLESAAGWKPGSVQSVAAHAIVGAATAALGGGNVPQGAEGAGLGEAALPYLTQYGTGGVLAGTTLVGALVGGGAGASTALAGTEYNYLSHPQVQVVEQACQGGGNTSACQQAMSTAKAQSLANDMQMELDCAGGGGSQACQQDLSSLMGFLDGSAPSSLTALQQGDQGLLEGGYFFSGPPGVPVGMPNARSLANSAGSGSPARSGDTSTLSAPTLGSAGGFLSGMVQGAVGAVAPYMDQYEGPNPNNPFVPYQAGPGNTPTSMTGQSTSVQQGYAAGQLIGGLLWVAEGDLATEPTATSTTSLGALTNQPLTLQYFQDTYGADNVTQGGGAVLQTRERVNANMFQTQQGNAASNFSQFSQAEGRLQETLGIWPPNGGTYAPTYNTTLDVGTQLDRYGYPGGNYLSLLGDSFEGRALPPSYLTTKPYFQYEVVQPITGVTQSFALPWFGQLGMDMQFQTPNSIQWYIDNGYLKEISK